MRSFFRKALAYAAFTLVLSIALSACTVLPAEIFADFDDYYSEYKVDFDITLDPELYGENEYYYRQLNDDEKKIYDAMVEEIAEGKNYCVFENVDADTIESSAERAFYAVYSDHPEFFWLELSWYFAKQEGLGENNDKAMLIFNCCDFWNINSANGMIATVEEKISEIVEGANKFTTDYEKIKYVHDLIVSNTEYDVEGMEEKNSVRNTVYSCLIENSAVCGGYSRTFQLLMNKLGIECISVLGSGMDEPHMWNCVYIDGEPYFMDLTWADSEDMINYEWFAVTGDDIDDTHEPEDRFVIPVCESSEYNYYVYNKLLLEKYDRGAFEDVLKRQKKEQIMFVKFSDSDALQEAIKDLITNRNWQELGILDGKSRLTYYIDEQALIFAIYN